MIDFLPEIHPSLGWALLILCGVMVGLAKNGVPGMGIMSVVIIASLLAAAASARLILA